MENSEDQCADSEPPTAYNLELNDAEAKEIKGDSIGDTLYSERFVLSTILKLTKLDDRKDEAFEKDLCSLWDMTIEKDVVKLLLEHSVLEIFTDAIQNSNDPRLVEILIGTVANMCSLKETRDYLCANPDVTYPIMENIACFDSLTLIQLMRFFMSVLVFENSGDESLWFAHFEQIPHFVDRFAFILSNSCNVNLLVSAIEAINVICTKFSILDAQQDQSESAKDFKEVFVQTSLVASINDAFKQLLFPDTSTTTDGQEGEDEDGNEIEELMSKKKNRIMNLFLDILVILSGFDSISMEAFIDCLPETLDNVARILVPLCSPINLLPLTTNEQGVIENVNELFQALQDPFHSECFSRIVHIYSIVDGECREKRKEDAKKGNDSTWEADKEAGDTVNIDEMSITLLELITRIAIDVEQEKLESSVKELGPIPCQAVFDGLNTENRDEDIQVVFDKFKLALKNLWNVVREDGDVQL